MNSRGSVAPATAELSDVPSSQRCNSLSLVLKLALMGVYPPPDLLE